MRGDRKYILKHTIKTQAIAKKKHVYRGHNAYYSSYPVLIKIQCE